MKTKLIFICVLLGLCGNVFAQDFIHTADGRSIKAKVLEINEVDILFKTFDNLEGPDYRLPVDRVNKIVFENGTVKSFAPAIILSPYAADPYYGPLEYRRGYYHGHYRRMYADQVPDYLKASRQHDWGLWLTVGGTTLLVASIVSGAMEADFNRSVNARGSSLLPLHIAGGIAGAACVGAGIPLWVNGSKQLDAIAEEYKRRNAGHAYNQRLSIGNTANGIGLAFRF